MTRKLKNGNVVQVQSSGSEPTIAELNKVEAYKAHKDIHDHIDRVEIGHGITSIDDVLASGALFLSDGNFVVQLYSRNSYMQTLTTEGNAFEDVLTNDLAVVCGGQKRDLSQ